MAGDIDKLIADEDKYPLVRAMVEDWSNEQFTTFEAAAADTDYAGLVGEIANLREDCNKAGKSIQQMTEISETQRILNEIATDILSEFNELSIDVLEAFKASIATVPTAPPLEYPHDSSPEQIAYAEYIHRLIQEYPSVNLPAPHTGVGQAFKEIATNEGWGGDISAHTGKDFLDVLNRYGTKAGPHIHRWSNFLKEFSDGSKEHNDYLQAVAYIKENSELVNKTFDIIKTGKFPTAAGEDAIILMQNIHQDILKTHPTDASRVDFSFKHYATELQQQGDKVEVGQQGARQTIVNFVAKCKQLKTVVATLDAPKAPVKKSSEAFLRAQAKVAQLKNTSVASQYAPKRKAPDLPVSVSVASSPVSVKVVGISDDSPQAMDKDDVQNLATIFEKVRAAYNDDGAEHNDSLSFLKSDGKGGYEAEFIAKKEYQIPKAIDPETGEMTYETLTKGDESNKMTFHKNGSGTISKFDSEAFKALTEVMVAKAKDVSKLSVMDFKPPEQKAAAEAILKSTIKAHLAAKTTPDIPRDDRQGPQ